MSNDCNCPGGKYSAVCRCSCRFCKNQESALGGCTRFTENYLCLDCKSK